MAYRLLLLEDDPDLRETLLDCLTEQGYEVVAVATGQEAVSAAARQEFDLFVSDIRMEGLNGLDAIEQAQGHQPGLTSMVVSGYSSEAETLRAIQLQVGAYMQKPFSLRDFLAQVQALLNQKQDQQKLSQQSTQLQRVLAWSLDSLIAVVDETALVGPVGYLQEVGQLIAAMSSVAELPPSLAIQVRLAAQFSALSRHPRIRLPHWIGEDDTALVELKTLVEKLGDQECRELPVLIARFALDKAQSEEENLGGLQGKYGAQILELFERSAPYRRGQTASEEVLRGLGDPQRVDRSLLALGRMFEKAGDQEHAGQAFEEIRGRSPNSWESVQAHLGLARLSFSTGHYQNAEGFAIAAYQKAQNLGPMSSARTCFEAGVLLAKMNAPLAPSALERACESLLQLGQSTLEAQARLALSLVRPRESAQLRSYAELLLQSGQVAELADSLDWILPILLEQADRERTLQAGILRLVTQYQDSLVALLAASRLPLESRRQLLEALRSSSLAAPGAVLAALRKDTDPAIREQATALNLGEESVSSSPLLRIHSLGFFHCLCGSHPVADSDYRSQKTKYFLAYLALNFGKPLPDEQLVEMFWPENAARGLKNLNSAVFRLRQCLKADVGSSVEVLIRNKSTIEFNREANFWHDFDELERAIKAGDRAREAGQAANALQQYRRASSLYGGPYLEGCFMEWALRRRSWVEERFTRCLQHLSELALATGSHPEVQEATNLALEIDSANQEIHLLKMKSFLASGKPEAAIRHFEKTERHLRQEYELEPSIELLKLYQMARYGLTV